MPRLSHVRGTAAFKRGIGAARSLVVLDVLPPAGRPTAAGGALHRGPLHTRAFDVATDEPIIASVAGRYASALFELAGEQGCRPEVEQNLLQFRELLDMSEDLRRLVRSPVFSAEEQGRALDVILNRAGIDGLAANFLKLVAKNRRLFAVSDMIRAYRALSARARGEVEAEVISAIALNEAQVSVLKQTLKVSERKNVQITTRVDSSLLGGLIVKIGSRMFDSSLRTKLESLKIAMKGIQ
jgi:F-type H+-transporting ATPase subunit delta